MAKAAPLGTVKRDTLSGSVYASIKQAIVSGDLPPGTRLTEKYLTEQLDVSRSPVREAISRLVHEGYLKGRPYEGYRVNRPTREEIRDTYEVLMCITETAVKLALERADEPQIAELISLVDAADEALARGEAEAYSDDGREFRCRAAAFCQNRQLEKLHEQYANHPALVQPWAVDDLESVRRRASDFSALREAIKNRNGIRAGEVVTANLRKNLQEVLNGLEESPKT